MHAGIRAAMGIFGLIAAYLALDLYHRLSVDQNTAVLLNYDQETRTNTLHLMVIAEVILITASTAHLLSGYYENHVFLDVSEAIFAVLTLIPIWILSSWRRWFQ